MQFLATFQTSLANKLGQINILQNELFWRILELVLTIPQMTSYMEPQWLCASCWHKEKSLGFVTFSGNKKQMVYKTALLPRVQNLCREVLEEMEEGG